MKCKGCLANDMKFCTSGGNISWSCRTNVTVRRSEDDLREKERLFCSHSQEYCKSETFHWHLFGMSVLTVMRTKYESWSRDE